MGKKQDVTNQEFGRLTFVQFVEIRKGKTFWLCRCHCGGTVVARVDQVKSGNTSSCGCAFKEATTEFEDLTGRKFGKLRVLRLADGRGSHGEIKWVCRCKCGGTSITTSGGLRSGHATSCGCRQREVASEHAFAMGKANVTHGDTGSPEYIVWRGIHARCSNPKNEAYQHYGERGIKVCKRWSAYENFLADMGRRPTPKHTIERKKTNGDYEPGNCCWATQKEQQRNRRNNILVTYKKRTQCIGAWAEESGLTIQQLWYRIKKCKLPPECAFADAPNPII